MLLLSTINVCLTINTAVLYRQALDRQAFENERRGLNWFTAGLITALVLIVSVFLFDGGSAFGSSITSLNKLLSAIETNDAHYKSEQMSPLAGLFSMFIIGICLCCWCGCAAGNPDLYRKDFYKKALEDLYDVITDTIQRLDKEDIAIAQNTINQLRNLSVHPSSRALQELADELEKVTVPKG